MISTCHFYPRSDGANIRKTLEQHGHLHGETETLSQELAIAVSNSQYIPSGGSEDCLFSLVWDMPEIKFGLGKRLYKRFGLTNSITRILGGIQHFFLVL